MGGVTGNVARICPMVSCLFMKIQPQLNLTIRLIRTSLHLLLLHELHGQTSMEFWQACAASNFLICYKHNSLPAEPFSVIHLCLLTVLKVLLGSTATRDCSVTRLGDLLNFGQLFKACGNN